MIYVPKPEIIVPRHIRRLMTRKHQGGFIINPYAFASGGAGGDSYYTNTILLDLWQGTNGATTFTDQANVPATLTGVASAALSNVRSLTGGATSLLLNGTTQHVTTNKSCNIGTGVFTIEANVRPTGAQTGRVVSCQSSGSPNALVMFRTESDGSLRFLMRSSAGGTLFDVQSAASLIAMNDTVAYHIAVTRDGSNRVDLWINGTSVANATSAINPNGVAAYNFGSQYGSAEWYKGYILACRVTEGVCRYTAGFTPPTALTDYPTHA